MLQIDVRGKVPSILMKRFLQRQPMAINNLRQCVMEKLHDQKPFHHTKFSFKGNTDKRTTEVTESSRELSLDSSSTDFTNNALRSFIFVNTSSRQYEDPVGISEFIGDNAAKQRRKQMRRQVLSELCGTKY